MKFLKIAIPLIAIIIATEGFAQNKTENKNQEKIKNSNNLTAPVVKPGESSYDARKASQNGNIAVIIAHGIDDPISGERYAKGFANGFARADKTGNKPIYITAVYREVKGNAPTYVEIFIDGLKWDYKDHFQLSPSDAGRLAPIIMNEYVAKHGTSKIIKGKPKTID